MVLFHLQENPLTNTIIASDVQRKNFSASVDQFVQLTCLSWSTANVVIPWNIESGMPWLLFWESFLLCMTTIEKRTKEKIYKSGKENMDLFFREIPFLWTYQHNQQQLYRFNLFFSCVGKWRQCRKSYSKLLGHLVSRPNKILSVLQFTQQGHSLQESRFCEQYRTLDLVRHQHPDL